MRVSRAANTTREQVRTQANALQYNINDNNVTIKSSTSHASSCSVHGTRGKKIYKMKKLQSRFKGGSPSLWYRVNNSFFFITFHFVERVFSLFFFLVTLIIAAQTTGVLYKFANYKT